MNQDPTFGQNEKYLRNITFIEDISELESLSVGTLVEVETLGPMVYEGKIGERYAFMNRRLPGGTGEINTRFINSFRGERPFITRNGKGVLDFRRWAQTAVYCPQDPIFQEKLKLLEAVGQ